MIGATESQEHETIAGNLVQAMSSYAQSTEHGDVTEAPGLALVSSGIPYAVFNAALLTPSFAGDVPAIEESVRVAARHYGERRLPWSCWTCQDLLLPEVRERAHAIFGRLGMRLVAEHQGMSTEQLTAASRVLPEMEMRQVSDEATRRDFVRVASSVFYVPPVVARQVYGSERYWRGHMVGWVGYLDGRPVSTAATVRGAGAVGVYCVATMAPHRGRGCAERITRHALERATPGSEYWRSILQSTPAGMPLYERMGYRAGTRFAVYVSQ